MIYSDTDTKYLVTISKIYNEKKEGKITNPTRRRYPHEQPDYKTFQ